MNTAELLRKVTKEYELAMRNDSKISDLYTKVAAGTATHEEAGVFAEMSGRHIGNILLANMQDAYPNGQISRDDAVALIPAPLRKNYAYVSDVATQIQNAVNQKNGIGLKAVAPDFDAVRARRIAEDISSKENFAEYAESFLLNVENASRKIVDDSLRINAGYQDAAGLEVRVTREYDGVGLHDGKDTCGWCLDRQGADMTLREAYDKGAFQRHPGCGCAITYTSRKGKITYQTEKGKWYDAPRR